MGLCKCPLPSSPHEVGVSLAALGAQLPPGPLFYAHSGQPRNTRVCPHCLRVEALSPLSVWLRANSELQAQGSLLVNNLGIGASQVTLR